MPTQIEISDSMYEKIRSALGPDDTAGSFVARAIDAFIREPKIQNSSMVEKLKFSGTHVPDLTFTKIISATINGTDISKMNWNTLTQDLLSTAKASGVNLLTFKSVRIVQGKKEGQGFWYVAPLEISFQGQSANDAWRAIIEIADRISARVEVQFCWKDNPKAAHPGINSVLVYP